MKRPIGFPVVIVFLFVLAGCDNFAVLAQFSRGGPLGLALQKSSLQQGETIAIYPSGGVPPYSFGIVAENLYYAGTTLGTISSQSYTAGNVIGSVEIVVTDGTGNSANSLATIVPPTPGGFTAVANTSTHTITLSWTYANPALISGFQIWCSVNGGAFTQPATAASTATSYPDSGLNQNFIYTYKIYAVAGSFLSLPTPEQSAQP